ncbi:hypothetical protein A3C89_00665 [Candidatus Kaiserbacteria bacterium RIFCSPHIGHO2_02_FULL_50_50]|uniref:RNA polymerase sigma factor n=1 Tax=Candidatus Kaiserbacteria bacterium RIFCSPHIGHO2_02_FULL_50_50 TaxID=1798492 RepID=A0A1F6DFT5_9BACT|nr:MAG: hypothetical protein A3C89_00665 [Candidatus Kaiserbacteria bacterium RIFCSPHIGHO2_02_FULL_50_50]OGG88864.1 MAG: hypothetical protein A3G62_03105 [Candidatus Kaiserbacteria bacterium RIFCSPLOWO2_12_FULL_50_10]
MQDIDALSDETIIKRVCAGETYLYGHIMDRYADKLVRYGRKFVTDSTAIEDAVQDVFTSAYLNINSFDTSRKFQSWIYRIAHNAFVNLLRQKKRAWLSVEWDTLVAFPSFDTHDEDERQRKEIAKLIDAGLEGLDEKYREILLLHYQHNFAYKDISDVLHIPMGTVAIRMKRAKAALQKQLPHDIYEK